MSRSGSSRSKQSREADKANAVIRRRYRDDTVTVRLAPGVQSSAGTGPAVVKLPRAEAEALTRKA